VTRFYIENFGCRATQADGAALERQFLERGLERTGASRDAEIVVLNTCTVTASADKDARAAVRRVRRDNPDCRILVTGCYAQRAPEEVAALPGVTWVVGNSHKHQAAEIAVGSRALSAGSGFISLRQLTGVSQTEAPALHVGDIFAHTELMAAPVFEAANERTRPNLKVQDGCDNRCSFCVIPYVRGQSRSLPLERVIAEVQTLVEAGYREVVISGINLGRWGRDLPAASDQPSAINHQVKPQPTGSTLAGLIRTILARTSLEKLRISSVEPMDWTEGLIRLMASSPRIAKHAHVPMQSGSDAVLRRMHRKYRPWHYREKIWKIRDAMPDAAIGADVMVGFPGESAAEFEETRRMVEELPFTYLHVFTYSPRPGTPAALHKQQIPVSIAKERNGILREIASAKKRAFMESLVGREVEAITLQTGGTDFTEGLTDNYLKVRIPERLEGNHWLRLSVQAVEREVLIGVPIGNGCFPGLSGPGRQLLASAPSRTNALTLNRLRA
jgi:threonylcarbamoyladenosine tRNA methylthiotransferase MtaB